MSHEMSHDKARHHLSLEDGLTIWQARDAYRVQNVLYSLVLLVFFLEGVSYATDHQWLEGMAVIAIQWVLLKGLVKLIQYAWRGMGWLGQCLQGWLHAWWHGLVLVLILGGLLMGCQAYANGLARLAGVCPNPPTYTCAPTAQKGQ